ncbi:MAG: immunoglobulin domain-containing protein, partial [Chitinophagales bacterium]|nr:immunoglobulin domain-containing protein [Chitinophagales bacterium]
ANSNSPLCAGQTLQLQSQGGYVSYQWSGPGGFTSNQQNPSIPNANASNAGVYTVTVNDGTGSCSSTITVVVNPYLSPTITQVGPFCTTDPPVILNAATPGGTWSASCGACIKPQQANLTHPLQDRVIILFHIPLSMRRTDTKTITVNNCNNSNMDSLGVTLNACDYTTFTYYRYCSIHISPCFRTVNY